MSRGFGGVYIDGADFNGQCPVLTHGGIVDVDAEVLAFLYTNGKPVRERPLLDPVTAVPQGLGLLDGVLHRLGLPHFYDD